MKKVILCPNPYRDSELRVCKEAKKLLDALHFQTVVCLPFQREGYGAELGLRITPLHQEIRSADLLIAFGGDGTILHLARTVALHSVRARCRMVPSPPKAMSRSAERIS